MHHHHDKAPVDMNFSMKSPLKSVTSFFIACCNDTSSNSFAFVLLDRQCEGIIVLFPSVLLEDIGVRTL